MGATNREEVVKHNAHDCTITTSCGGKCSDKLNSGAQECA